MPDAETLRVLFGQPPEAAIRHLQAKGLRITFNWQEMLDHAHARAFTVAKAMRFDILQDIRRGLLEALERGQPQEDFAQALKPLLQAKGWWGKAVVVDPDTQEAQLVQLGSARRLKTIYRTNVQSAYMAGRYRRQMAAEGFPYLMYVAVMDGRTRPSHAALNGKVYAKDDPVWDVIYPPNGFNCRCRTRALTAGQVAREGRRVEDSPRLTHREVRAGIDPVTGEAFHARQYGLRVKDASGQMQTMWVDVGFNASPAASHVFDDLLYRKAEAAVGRPDALRLVGEILTSAPRLAAWRAFVTNTLATGLVQHQTMTLGLMPAKVSAKPVIVYLDDTLIVGPKARRHALDGEGLDPADWERLPVAMQDAAWYTDGKTGNVVAVINDIALYIDLSGKVKSVYRDPLIGDKIKGGRLKAVE